MFICLHTARVMLSAQRSEVDDEMVQRQRVYVVTRVQYMHCVMQ